MFGFKIGFKKESKEKNLYHVEFSRSTYVGDTSIRSSAISVFEGTKEACESYVKTQVIDWALMMIDMPDEISKQIETSTNWQELPSATLRFYQWDKDADVTYSAYTYYNMYNDNYYDDLEF